MTPAALFKYLKKEGFTEFRAAHLVPIQDREGANGHPLTRRIETGRVKVKSFHADEGDLHLAAEIRPHVNEVEIVDHNGLLRFVARRP